MSNFYLISLCIIILNSCYNENVSSVKIQVDLKKDYIDNYFSKYETLRQSIADSIVSYKADSLYSYKGYFFDDNWMIDSVIFFNSDSSRFYTKMLSNQSRRKNKKIDGIIDFGGAFIEDKWYFFEMGTSTIVPRDHYHHDPYEPLTFEELSYIAWRRSIPGLIYRDDQGKVVGNSKAIDRMFLSPDKYYCPDPDRVRQCNDSITLAQHKIWTKGKISKAEIQRIEAKIEATTRPPAPPPRKWYQQPKLFDSKAWRNRRKG